MYFNFVYLMSFDEINNIDNITWIIQLKDGEFLVCAALVFVCVEEL